MIEYNPNEPLIFLHIPKTGGTSVRSLFEIWFSENLRVHYYDATLNRMPEKHPINEKTNSGKPLIVYGHFNRRRSFGVEDYYPDARQFITILRDPFERVVSSFFYLKKISQENSNARVPFQNDLVAHVRSMKSLTLAHFPREVTLSNYKEIIEKFFVAIGTLEKLHASMSLIAQKLQMPYNKEMLEVLNFTHRDQDIPRGLRDRYIEENALEYIVYNYVKDRITL
jgi:hypothetical protein